MLASVEDCGEDGGAEPTASSSDECNVDHGLDGKEKRRTRKLLCLPGGLMCPS